MTRVDPTFTTFSLDIPPDLSSRAWRRLTVAVAAVISVMSRHATVSAIVSLENAASPSSSPLSRNIFCSRENLLWLSPLVFPCRSRSLCGPGPPVGATNVIESITHLATVCEDGIAWRLGRSSLDLRVASRKPIAEIRCVDYRHDQRSGISNAQRRSSCAVAGRCWCDCRRMSFFVTAANVASSCILNVVDWPNRRRANVYPKIRA